VEMEARDCKLERWRGQIMEGWRKTEELLWSLLKVQ
jgi:hypothetical protein